MIGAHAIEASAGTGKTYAITRLWLGLLVTERLRVDRILVSTFTKAATAELQERLLATLDAALALARDPVRCAERSDDDLAELIAGARAADPDRDLVRELETARSDFDLAPIATIHGFCHGLIARHALELGADPDVELVTDQSTLLEPLVADVLAAESDAASLAPADAHSMAERLAAEAGLPADQLILPEIPADPDPAHYRACLADLSALLPAADAAVRRSVAKNSVAKTLRVFADLAAGSQRAESLAAGARAKLAEHWPEGLRALDAAAAAIAARRAAAVHALARAVRHGLPAEKQRAGLRSFDDVLITVRDALLNPAHGARVAAAVRAAYDAVIVDECQDSDGVQIEVLRRLFLGPEPGTTAAPVRSLTVIGDPKQSIYRFRGADLGSYRRLIACTAPGRELRTNYRSDGPLVAALNALYAHHNEFTGGEAGAPIRYQPVSAHCREARIHDPGIADPERGALLALWSDRDERERALRDLAVQTARECRRLLDAGVRVDDRHRGGRRRLRADDIALLAHNHRQLAILRRACRTEGLSCQQAGRGAGSVLATDEADDLQVWLEALVAAAHGGEGLLARLLALVATPLWGASAESCLSLAADPAAQADLAERCRGQAEDLRRHGPLSALLRHLDRDQHLVAVLAGPGGERRVTNWRHLAGLLQERWAAGERDPSLLLLAFERLRADGGTDDDTDVLRLETDLPAIQLSTIHNAKGLEYPVVCCPFLWSVASRQSARQRCRSAGALVRDGARACLDLGGPDHERHSAADLAEQDAEQERLLYVALTRARHRCYLGLAPVTSGGRHHANGAENSALARLLGLDDHEPAHWRAQLPAVLPLLGDLLDPEATAPDLTDAAPALDLAEPPAVAPLAGAPLRTLSFSALAAGEHAVAIARDHDEGRTAAPEGMRDPGLLAGLGGGTGLGDRVHGILEDVLGNRRDLDAALGPRSDDRERLRDALRTILATPIALPGAAQPAPTLADLAAGSLAELHFVLPLAETDPAALARALLADPQIADDPQRRAWAEGIAGWPFGRVHGYLQGYIDLVVEHQGRWYVADYKTNQLAEYTRAACERAMLEHDYLLQGRLYLLALHRHLRHHLADYAPERHLGGCAYAFVRGFPVRGLWTEPASRSGIEALDALFSGGQA